MEESSSDDSSDEEEEAKPPAKPAAKAPTPAKPAVAKKDESSSDDSDSDEEEKPAAKTAPAKAAPSKAAPAVKMEESSSDDSSDEEEEAKPPVKPQGKAQTPAKPAAAKEDESSDDSDSDEDEPASNAAPAKATPAKAPAKDESSSEEESSDEDEKPAAKVAVAPTKVTKEEDSSDDSSDDEDEKKPVVTPAKAAPVKKDDSSSDEDSSDEEEDEKPVEKVKKEADDGEMKMVNNKDKKEEIKTPTKNNQSFGGGESEEGRKIFIHNVGENTVYEDFQEKVEKFGEVTDFFNSGRGFAFVTYSAPAEATACIAAMDNTEVAGKTIQMNLARPKGAAPTGGKTRSEAPEGCKLFVHGVTQEINNSDLQAAFEKYGTVTDAYNPGKGFAFVTFTKAAEATAAMEALEGQEVCGAYISVSVAKPRGGGDTPRGGGRGGAGGGGGGGRRNDQEGCKLFVHNVSEETSQDDLWNAFAEHGTVTDAYNPGRGFAFITYSNPKEANTAMEALEGQEVCGRTIQCNIAKPKGDKGDGAGRGGRGGRGGGRGGGGRGGRGGRGGMQISASGGGGHNKKKSFD